jgi:hypothetical protein
MLTCSSTEKAVSSWLKLATAQRAAVDLIAAQDDPMARGARKAFQAIPNDEERRRWLKLPFTGCHGQLKTGQACCDQGSCLRSCFAWFKAIPLLCAISFAISCSDAHSIACFCSSGQQAATLSRRENSLRYELRTVSVRRVTENSKELQYTKKEIHNSPGLSVGFDE